MNERMLAQTIGTILGIAVALFLCCVAYGLLIIGKLLYRAIDGRLADRRRARVLNSSLDQFAKMYPDEVREVKDEET